ncbi:MAG: tetratricopeptide repeat protein [bacterium]
MRSFLKTSAMIVFFCSVFPMAPLSFGQELARIDLVKTTTSFTGGAKPTPLSELIESGDKYVAAGSYNSAAAVLNQALQLEPDRQDLRLRLSRVLSWARRYTEALQQYRSILETDPHNLDAMAGTAQVLAWKGDLEKSVQTYQQALYQYPQRDDLHRGLGQVLGWQGKLRKAEAELRKAIQLNPESPANHKVLATIISWQGRYSEAIQNYKQAIEKAPDDPDAYASLMQVYRWSRRYGEALRTYQLALHNVNSSRELTKEAQRSQWNKALKWRFGFEQDYLSKLWTVNFALPATAGLSVFGTHSHLDRTTYFRDREEGEIRHYWSRGSYVAMGSAFASYRYTSGLKPDNTALKRSFEVNVKLFIEPGLRTGLSMRVAVRRTKLQNWAGITGHPVILEALLDHRWTRWLKTEAGLALYRDFDPNLARTLKKRTFSLFKFAANFDLPANSTLAVRYIPNRDLDNTIAHSYEAVLRKKLGANSYFLYRYLRDSYRNSVLVNQHYLGIGFRAFNRFQLALGDNYIQGSYKKGNYLILSVESRLW